MTNKTKQKKTPQPAPAVKPTEGTLPTQALDKTLQITQNQPNTEEQERTTKSKKIFLEIYEKTMGTITVACEKADITRRTYYNWINEDAEFRKAIEDRDEMKADMVEDRLYKLIQQDDGPSVRFYLERRVPKFKAKTVLEHQTSKKTLVDLLRQDEEELKEKKDGIIKTTTGTDRGAPENPGQEQKDSPVQTERGPEVLLGKEDPKEPDLESKAEGTD